MGDEATLGGYQGKFGRESTWDFLKNKDWYDQMFHTYAGMSPSFAIVFRTIRYAS